VTQRIINVGNAFRALMIFFKKIFPTICNHKRQHPDFNYKDKQKRLRKTKIRCSYWKYIIGGLERQTKLSLRASGSYG